MLHGDYLGFERIYVQAKRYTGAVNRMEISQFIGDISAKGAHKGVFITTSSFSEEMRRHATSISSLQLVLLDGHDLVTAMTKLRLGISVRSSYEVPTLDNEFFENI